MGRISAYSYSQKLSIGDEILINESMHLYIVAKMSRYWHKYSSKRFGGGWIYRNRRYVLSDGSILTLSWRTEHIDDECRIHNGYTATLNRSPNENLIIYDIRKVKHQGFSVKTSSLNN